RQRQAHGGRAVGPRGRAGAGAGPGAAGGRHGARAGGRAGGAEQRSDVAVLHQGAALRAVDGARHDAADGRQLCGHGGVRRVRVRRPAGAAVVGGRGADCRRPGAGQHKGRARGPAGAEKRL
ncbi:hypothetical protein IWW52_004458, partial [Coemansia sp. RSA 2704]